MRHVDAVPREGLRRLLVVRNIFAIFTAVAQCGVTSCQVERTPAIGRRKGQSRRVGLFDRSQPSHRGRGREGTGAKNESTVQDSWKRQENASPPPEHLKPEEVHWLVEPPQQACDGPVYERFQHGFNLLKKASLVNPPTQKLTWFGQSCRLAKRNNT